MIPMPGYHHPRGTLVVRVELNTCQKEERPELQLTVQSAQPICPTQRVDGVPRHMQSILVIGTWTRDDWGSEAVMNVVINDPHSHAGLGEDNVFTWQHRKSDVPKGETRTD